MLQDARVKRGAEIRSDHFRLIMKFEQYATNIINKEIMNRKPKEKIKSTLVKGKRKQEEFQKIAELEAVKIKRESNR